MTNLQSAVPKFVAANSVLNDDFPLFYSSDPRYIKIGESYKTTITVEFAGGLMDIPIVVKNALNDSMDAGIYFKNDDNVLNISLVNLQFSDDDDDNTKVFVLGPNEITSIGNYTIYMKFYASIMKCNKNEVAAYANFELYMKEKK